MDRPRDSRIEIRKARQGPEEAALDRAYWAALTPEQRIELVWELTVEQWRMRGWDPDEPGLCRSVAVLHRR
jgi:hypothetical protein